MIEISIINAIREFKEYSDTNLYSIKQIKYWLKEHNNLYNSAKLNWNNGSCYGELPCCHTMNNEHSRFMHFYESLSTVFEFHQSEAYFEKELAHYHFIKDDLSALKEWVRKNEELGASKFISFVIDYLDYSDNPYHLSIFILNFEDFQVFVDRKYFVNTITFLVIFNKLYWEEQILPVSIERINSKNKSKYSSAI